MADTFGLKIGLEGEKEFKKALSDINQSFKVLGSEMKLVQSQFGKNDNSAEALAAKHSALNKQIDAQKQKIEMLQKALDNATESLSDQNRIDGYPMADGTDSTGLHVPVVQSSTHQYGHVHGIRLCPEIPIQLHKRSDLQFVQRR